MALSVVVSKGLVSGSMGKFGRSTSCGDLSSMSASREGIQLFLSTPGKGVTARVLATDCISLVNVKVRAPPAGSSAVDRHVMSGSVAADGLVPEAEEFADNMQIVLGLSDLMSFSVSTASGKEYAFSRERSGFPTSVGCSILEGEEYNGRMWGNELVPFTGSAAKTLHVVADRRFSKVHVDHGAKDNLVELSVRSSPAAAIDCWRSESEATSPCLLQDSELVQDEEPHLTHIPLLAKVDDGLSAGHSPQLTADGSGGTYFMADGSGQKVAVFKPVDEEPLALNNPRGMAPSSTGEGLKKGTRVGEGAFREVAAYLLDYPSMSSDSDGGFSGVPCTFLVRCDPNFFPPSAEVSPRSELFSSPFDTSKLGSLQEFVPAMSNCEDMGPQRFPVHEVHKIAVLDMRLGNTDRNGANILVQNNGSDLRLIPIDHGYCLPETLEDLTFEWLYWPQAKSPFDQETKDYIASLDSAFDVELLKQSGWEVNDAVALTMHTCTMLLKKGVASGLTPYEIGSLMVRQHFDHPSALECMVEEAEACVDRLALGQETLLSVLSDVMDKELFTARKQLT